MPDSVIDPEAEYRAATTGAALFDLSDCGKVRAVGRDAAMFLGNLSTNDVKALGAGTACESYFCDARAKTLFQTVIHRIADQPPTYWIGTSAGRGAALFAHLDRYLISEDVALDDVTEAYAQYHLGGPNAEEVLARAGSTPLPKLEANKGVELVVGGAKCTILRLDRLGMVGFELVTKKSQVETLLPSLTGAGAVPAGEETFRMLRVEAAEPVYGEDIDESRFVAEIGGFERAVSYTKGCYLGQEPIVMARDRAGHAPRAFVQIRFPRDAGIAPRARIVLLGEEVGIVTSIADSPRYDARVALGYVRWKHRVAGTKLEADAAQGLVEGEVMNR